jgi:hypothetical protein
MLIRSYFFKNSDPIFTQHFLKVNTCPHFITDDLKILSIHNQTLLGKNNKVGCLSKTWINNRFMLKLCLPSDWKKEKFLKFLLAVTNNQYGFSVVIGACTFK